MHKSLEVCCTRNTLLGRYCLHSVTRRSSCCSLSLWDAHLSDLSLLHLLSRSSLSSSCLCNNHLWRLGRMEQKHVLSTVHTRTVWSTVGLLHLPDSPPSNAQRRP